MKYLFPFILLFSFSCGKERLCNFYADNICVNVGQYDIESQLVSFVVDSVEKRMLEYTNKKHNISKLAEQENLYVMYADPDSIPSLCSNVENARGCIHFPEDEIYVAGYLYENEISIHSLRARCISNYYVLGHEFLHFIIDHDTNISNKNNINHNVKNIFIIWAARNDKQLNLNAEGQMYIDVVRKCKEVFPEDEQ